MKGQILIAVLFISQLSYGQLSLRPIAKKESESKNHNPQRAINKNTLPFWDDFSISVNTPDALRIWGTDTTRQWNQQDSRNVLVNATLAKNPPSYGVVTFDGLDSLGQFHGTGKGLTDQLVSDTIDLSSYNESDDIYFSFYWQAGGNVEIPDAGDSLVLQFYDSGRVWNTVWLIDGEDVQSDSSFFQESIKVTQEFITDEFVFRFQAYGDQDGPFDAWHIDWIYMNDNRESDDFFYLDRGFTGQLTSPFRPFKALPIHQFLANPMELTSDQRVQAFNLDEFIQPTEYILVIRDLVNDIRIDSIQYGDEDPLEPNNNAFESFQNRVIQFDGIDLTSLNTGDSIVIQSETYLQSSFDEFLDGTQVDLRINDTLRAEYLLYDHYAYDDGTAEYAVGTNIRGGQAGVKFWVEEQDTVTHIDIFFPNIDPPSDDNSLTLRIYRNLGDQFALRTQSISIETANAIDQFTRYQLDRPLVVSDTFYITYEQNVNEYVGIGFDRSNPEAGDFIYEVIDEEWVQNDRLQGALMIRPIFKPALDFILGTDAPAEEFVVYPNPTNGQIKISGHYQKIQLRNLAGKLVFEEGSKSSHDFSNLPAGLYLLSIQHDQKVTTQKIRIE